MSAPPRGLSPGPACACLPFSPGAGTFLGRGREAATVGRPPASRQARPGRAFDLKAPAGVQGNGPLLYGPPPHKASPLRVLVALLVASFLAGCQASPALERLRGDAPAPEPLFFEHRVDAGAGHDRSYALEVGDRATEVNVTLRLEPRGGFPLAASPARLEVTLFAPSGDLVSSATAEPSRPLVSLVARDLAERGAYEVRVVGHGLSQNVQEQPVGASYVLTLEVLHE